MILSPCSQWPAIIIIIIIISIMPNDFYMASYICTYGGHIESVKLSGHHELHLFHC